MADIGRLGLNDNGRGIAFDSFGNVYIAGFPDTAGVVREPWFLAKYTPDGSLLWQKNIATSSTFTGGPDDQPLSLMVSGNFIYMYGSYDRAPSVLKLDLDGSIIWQTSISFSFTVNITSVENSFAGDSLVVDSSNNVYIAWSDTSRLILVKFNSSGVLQWQKSIRSTSADASYLASLSITQLIPGFTTQYLYVHGLDFSSGSPIALIITIDLNGNVTGYEQNAPSIANPSPRGALAVGTSGTAFRAYAGSSTSVAVTGPGGWTSIISGFPSATGSGTSGGITNTQYPDGAEYYSYSSFCISNVIYIIKHNYSGTVMFQRSISIYPSLSLTLKRIRADAYGNLYFVGTSSAVEQSASTNIFFGKIPTDGSLTGTYMLGAAPNGYVNYAATTLPVSTGTLFTLSRTYTTATTIYTTSSPAANTSAATLSSTTVII
jgi:hypothetical protein